ncbi:MAG TPA: FeoC-like transcriptional regulator [Anaerolineaceae bacterium]|nr:FeoC-like transcriptional regulator [Anaerolineaceae bacterium]HQN43678.1 FeoC-like transcriptional regulator [Anaerolineaceae bacterium]
MLEKLLAEIRSGGTLEIRSLAHRLDTTPEVVTAMLEHLHRAGYIQPYQTCSSACDGCGLKNACKTTPQAVRARLWQA